MTNFNSNLVLLSKVDPQKLIAFAKESKRNEIKIKQLLMAASKERREAERLASLTNKKVEAIIASYF